MFCYEYVYRPIGRYCRPKHKTNYWYPYAWHVIGLAFISGYIWRVVRAKIEFRLKISTAGQSKHIQAWPPKVPHPAGGFGSHPLTSRYIAPTHLTDGFLDPGVYTQAASWSVQSFPQGSHQQTDRHAHTELQTDHAICVVIGRIAIRPKT